jgi:putative transcriptional regulator
MLAKRKMRSNELAAEIGITPQNLSVLKAGRAKAIKLETLEKICDVLQCSPGDILEFRKP